MLISNFLYAIPYKLARLPWRGLIRSDPHYNVQICYAPLGAKAIYGVACLNCALWGLMFFFVSAVSSACVDLDMF